MYNKKRNEQSKKDIVKILKDSFNNENVSFYFIRVFELNEKADDFLLPEGFEVKGKDNILVASNLFYLLSEIYREAEWQIEKFAEYDGASLIFDIGAAYPAKINNQFQKYTNFSAAVNFNDAMELAHFVNDVYSEVSEFLGKQSKKDIKQEMKHAVNRNIDEFNEGFHEEIETVISDEDVVLREKLAEMKSKKEKGEEFEMDFEVEVSFEEEDELEQEDFEVDSEFTM